MNAVSRNLFTVLICVTEVMVFDLETVAVTQSWRCSDVHRESIRGTAQSQRWFGSVQRREGGYTVLDKRLRRKRGRSQRKYTDVVKWDIHRVGVTVEDGGIGGDGERWSTVGVATEEGKSLLLSMWDYSVSQVWRVLFLAWVSNNEVLIRSIWALNLNSECSFCFSRSCFHENSTFQYRQKKRHNYCSCLWWFISPLKLLTMKPLEHFNLCLWPYSSITGNICMKAALLFICVWAGSWYVSVQVRVSIWANFEKLLFKKTFTPTSNYCCQRGSCEHDEYQIHF